MLTGSSRATETVGWAVAELLPDVFVAVTRTVIVNVSSLFASRYVVPVAPATGWQFWPRPSQRSHWSVIDDGLFVHTPGLAVSALPRCTVPVTVGATDGCGRGWAWIVSAVLCAVELRPGEVAVTVRMIVWPSSAAPRGYEVPVPHRPEWPGPCDGEGRLG